MYISGGTTFIALPPCGHKPWNRLRGWGEEQEGITLNNLLQRPPLRAGFKGAGCHCKGEGHSPRLTRVGGDGGTATGGERSSWQPTDLPWAAPVSRSLVSAGGSLRSLEGAKTRHEMGLFPIHSSRVVVRSACPGSVSVQGLVSVLLLVWLGFFFFPQI